MLSIDPNATRAVLIGASEFAEDPVSLPPLPAVRANVEDLKALLADPEIIGIPEKHIITILDEPDYPAVAKKLAQEAREATDTLIVYYAGHGVLGKRTPKFFLAVGNTIEAEADYTALPFEHVRLALSESSARKKILILDCCFSARALDFMAAERSLMQSNLDLKGTYALASAPANQPAIAPKGERHTTFTGELLRVLREGLETGEKALSLKDIYQHIRHEFRARPRLPEPQQAHIQDAADILLARNRKFREPVAELPADLQEALASPKLFERVGATHELERLLRSSDKSMARAAHQVLARLQSDDSRRVSESAKKILAAHGELQRPAKEKEERELPEPATLKPGTVFHDTLKNGSKGPEMVVIPAGSFMMGSPKTEEGRNDAEGPRHWVNIRKPFAMGKYPVTFDEYDKFDRAMGRVVLEDEGWGRGNRPVINVSWNDAVAYAEWLSEQTGKPYRLPSEAEWEYAARAGTEFKYWWGDEIGHNRANCDGCGSQWDGKQTAPVGSFEANPFGLYDTVGNVWEWVQDGWNGSYEGAPEDGSAWLSGDCGLRVLRGGAWFGKPRIVRSAGRYGIEPDFRCNFPGFRLAQDV